MYKSRMLDVRKVIILSVWFVFAILWLTGCSPQPDIKMILKTIPNDHRENIENLFLQLCINSSAAYTLFGPKPMSNEGYTDDVWVMTPLELHFPSETLVFKHGWDSWTRYRDLFPSQKFSLKRIPFRDHPSYWHIFLVNKSATLTVLKRHIETFNEVLDSDYSAEDLWAKMDGSDSFFQSIVEHTELLGILLGYGRANAEAFTRRAEICFYLSRYSTPPFQLNHEWEKLTPESQRFVHLYTANISPVSLIPKTLEPSAGYHSLADELNAICSRTCFFELEGCHHFLEYYGRPVFMTLENEPEAAEWKQLYIHTQKHLNRVLKGKPFIETVLTQWMR